MLADLPPLEDPNVLVGTGTRDDAAVYRLSEDIALVQTVDIITPIVDDPYVFGQVAAANALSDVYAMGARPLCALSFVGFSTDRLPLSDMVLILKGGIDKAREAGIEIVGGHSIDDNEPKYGLCVTGVVHPERICRNSTARAGDVLFLTKPLGSGILTTALKKKRLDPSTTEGLVAVMSRLNGAASEAMLAVGVDACTDVTGFGLLGHLLSVVQASGLCARIWLSRVPVMEAVRTMAQEGFCPAGTRRNLAFCSPHVEWGDDIDEIDKTILADAQTSGGLLIAVQASRADDLKRALRERGVPTYAPIGELFESDVRGRIEVTRG